MGTVFEMSSLLRPQERSSTIKGTEHPLVQVQSALFIHSQLIINAIRCHIRFKLDHYTLVHYHLKYHWLKLGFWTAFKLRSLVILCQIQPFCQLVLNCVDVAPVRCHLTCQMMASTLQVLNYHLNHAIVAHISWNLIGSTSSLDRCQIIVVSIMSSYDITINWQDGQI